MDPTELEGLFTQFGEHGLPGLIIFALFVGMAGIFWTCRRDAITAREDARLDRDAQREVYITALDDITARQERSTDKVVHVLEKIETLIISQSIERR